MQNKLMSKMQTKEIEVATIDKPITVDLGNTKKGDNDTRTKYPTFLKNFRYYLIEYSETTSIHGVKLLCGRGGNILERLWWLIFLGVSLYFCVSLIIDTYKKWERSPVFVTLATTQTSISEIPFPAVTVCPQVKMDNVYTSYFSALINQCENKENLTETQKEYLHYLSLICSNGLNNAFFENCTNSEEKHFSSNKPAEFFLEIRPRYFLMAVVCYLAGAKCTMDIDEVFIPIVTREGVCFSFNMLDRDEIYTSESIKDHYDNLSIPHQPQSTWSLENGYIRSTSASVYPRKARTSGITGGMNIIFQMNSFDLNDTCGYFVQGYKIIIHNPGQVPNTNSAFFYVGFDQAAVAAVKPNLMTTSKQLQAYPSKDRKCYFNEEKRLKFFKVYDQQNCLIECLTNFTYKSCGCVGFDMPHQYLVNEDDINTVDAGNYCNCLPTCTSLDYEVDISNAVWNWKHLFKTSGAYFEESDQWSALRIYFKDIQFVTYQRSELFGQTDFLANCGGLLGLFTGFSFISIVEILYFATLKCICNFRKFGRLYWSGAPELLDIKV